MLKARLGKGIPDKVLVSEDLAMVLEMAEAEAGPLSHSKGAGKATAGDKVMLLAEKAEAGALVLTGHQASEVEMGEIGRRWEAEETVMMIMFLRRPSCWRLLSAKVWSDTSYLACANIIGISTCFH